MYSGGKVTNSKPADLSSAVNEFVRVVGDYVPSLRGLQAVAKKVVELGLPLRQACMALQKIDKQKFNVGLKYAAEAPKSFSLPRADVLANLLCDLWESNNVNNKAFAANAAATWLDEMGLFVRGRYDNTPKK